ncbi:MAG: hypothetical protein K9N23_00465 [Akkermansiaceae bacterium]|nr:hypothetical protein [Akkermansiaceae bacterium]MCF7730122.1 hypothetical protein [Akkermansiaceae bacterium]
MNFLHKDSVEKVFEERPNHIARLRGIQQKIGNDMLIEILSESPEDLSFPTAIEAELGIPAFDLIDPTHHRETQP